MAVLGWLYTGLFLRKCLRPSSGQQPPKAGLAEYWYASAILPVGPNRLRRWLCTVMGTFDRLKYFLPAIVPTSTRLTPLARTHARTCIEDDRTLERRYGALGCVVCTFWLLWCY